MVIRNNSQVRCFSHQLKNFLVDIRLKSVFSFRHPLTLTLSAIRRYNIKLKYIICKMNCGCLDVIVLKCYPQYEKK